MTWRNTPPFRADHVGSLIRPAELRAARRSFLDKAITREQLTGIEDRCIREAIALQERVGLQAITDGEFRRTSFREVLFDNVEGFTRDHAETDFAFEYADGTVRRATPVPKAGARLKRRGSMAAADFGFLKRATKGTAKAMIPSPSFAHWFIGDAVLNGVYADRAEYMADIGRIFAEEIAELASLGCTYLQIDEVPIPVMCDPKVQAIIARRGEDHLDLIDIYVDTINAALRGKPESMTVVVHMCRGNEGIAGLGSGGYDPITERVFQRLAVDGYLLEYESPRAGDFEPLRHLPQNTIAILGLMSTKEKALESADDLRRKVDEASRFVAAERLGLCPQCGFATAFHFDRLTIDDQERKLAHLVAVAHDIWD